MAQNTIALDLSNDIFMDPVTKTLGVTTTTSQTVAQRIRTELQTFASEYILNVDKGVPYFNEVMKKNPDMNAVRSLLVAHIGNVSDVASILSLDCSYDSNREFHAAFVVTLTDGTVVEGEI